MRKISHLHKLSHHHAFLIPEADHIEPGGEVRHVEAGDRVVALSREHHHAGEIGDGQETLRVVNSLELHMQDVAGGVGVEFHGHVRITG